MRVFTKPLMRFTHFLLNHCKIHLDDKEVDKQADYVEVPLRLMMHGVPRELVDRATPDQLRIMMNIVNRDTDQLGVFIANNVGHLFGSDDSDE